MSGKEARWARLARLEREAFLRELGYGGDAHRIESAGDAAVAMRPVVPAFNRREVA